MRYIQSDSFGSVRLVFLVAIAMLLPVCCSGTDPTGGLRRMGGGNYPQAFVWWTTANRIVENAKSDAEADRILSQLDGVASPCLHLDYFAGFKRRHPDQFVFLFCQGHDFSAKPTVFDPVDRSKFYPGHWVHCAAATITTDIAAAPKETDIAVDDVSKFRLTDANGRHRPDDICLVAIDESGCPDWSKVEQVRLVSIDKERSTIRVQRGCYETQPRAFKASNALAAPHASEPWGYNGGVSWIINYSAECPRDANGRTASDALFEVIAPMFASGGPVENFDGLELDVSPFSPTGQCVVRRPVDTNGDLRGDGGFSTRGVNLWGIGYYRFCERLRSSLGAHRWFMADGGSGAGKQRNFGVLNGIEREWWPEWGDNDITNWSNGFNGFDYWRLRCHTPSMNYMVHKIGGHDREAFVNAPWTHHRLVLATAQFLDAPVTSFYTPKPEPGQPFGIFDELVGGEIKQTGWLGRPLGPHQRPAFSTANLLEGVSLADHLEGPEVVVQQTGTHARISAKDSIDSKSMEFRLNDVPSRKGRDLLLRMVLSADTRPGWPDAIPRHMTVQPARGDFQTLDTYVGTTPFTATFYFRSMPSDRATLEFECEGTGNVTIHAVEAYAHTDAGYRLFENGLVLANPGDRPYIFDLTTIAPQTKFVRLAGSPSQDPATNNGQPVGATVTLKPRDGLFLLASSRDRLPKPTLINKNALP